MITSTLKKWRHNWKFMLGATVWQALITLFAIHLMGSDYGPQSALPIYVRALGWPLLTNIIDLNSSSDSSMMDVAFVLALVWNSFFWAWALLELKQVLARTFTLRSSLAE